MLDKTKIKAAFSRHAVSYDQAAGLQIAVGLELISQIKLNQPPINILDIGMGTGFLARELCRRNRHFKLFGCDIAHGMNRYNLQSIKTPLPIYPVTADAERLCFRAQQMDMIISNLSYQWLNEIGQGLSEARRALKPGGRLILTSMGEQTLHELRDCFTQAYREQKGQEPAYTHRFINKAKLLELMEGVGFKQVRVESRIYLRLYQGLGELLDALKQLGALNASVDRPRGLSGKAIIKRTQQLYRQKYSQAGQLKAGYEVLFAGGKS